MSAGILNYCSAEDVCYNVAIPESTSKSGSGNIYFQMTAKTSYSWVALGTGEQMAGSNMFIMYQDGKGNVTLSPRHGTFHTMPSQDTSSTAAKLTLLAGSGVNGDTMVANVMCSNCESWTGGGSLSVTSTSSDWIVAHKSGGSLKSTSKNAMIQQHDSAGSIALDLTKGTVSTDSNPFVSGGGASSSGGGSTSGTGSGSGSGSGSNSGTGSGSTSGSGSSGSGVVVTGTQPRMDILTAHGLVMALAFVVLYPLGSMLMPLLGKWYVHAGWQTVTFLLMWAGFGLGVFYAKQSKMVSRSAPLVQDPATNRHF